MECRASSFQRVVIGGDKVFPSNFRNGDFLNILLPRQGKFQALMFLTLESVVKYLALRGLTLRVTEEFEKNSPSSRPMLFITKTTGRFTSPVMCCSFFAHKSDSTIQAISLSRGQRDLDHLLVSFSLQHHLQNRLSWFQARSLPPLFYEQAKPIRNEPL